MRPGPLLSPEVLGIAMLSSAMFEKKWKRGSGLVVKWSGDTSPAVNGTNFIIIPADSVIICIKWKRETETETEVGDTLIVLQG